MILSYIKLENIRSYAEQEITFSRGTTLFGGDIGSGKSSILMGIEFALFGLGSQKGGGLLSKRKDRGSVTLDFEVDGRLYQVTRGLIRRNGAVSQDSKRSHLWEDGVEEALSPTDLKQRILKILGFNEPSNPRAESRIFRYAVFTPQEEIKHILNDPRDRLETIRKAFRIEDYRDATENAGRVAALLKARTHVLKERFKNLEELGERLDGIIKDIRRTDASISSEKEKIEEAEGQKRSLVLEQQGLKERENEAANLKLKRREIEGEIRLHSGNARTLQAKIQKSDEIIAKIQPEIARLESKRPPTSMTMDQLNYAIDRRSELKAEERGTASLIGTTSARIADLERRLGTQRDRDADELRKAISEATSQIEESARRLRTIDSRINELKEAEGMFKGQVMAGQDELDSIAGLGARCHTCKSEITAEHKDRLESGIRSRIREAQNSIAGITQELGGNRSEKARLEGETSQDRDSINAMERTIPDLKELPKKRAELQGLRLQQDRIQSQYAAISGEFADLPASITDGELSLLRSGLQDYQNAQNSLKYLRDNLERACGERETAEQERESAHKRMQERESDMEATDEQLKSFEGIASKMAEIDRKIDDLAGSISSGSGDIRALEERKSADEGRKREHSAQIVEANRWKREHERISGHQRWIEDYFIPATRQIERQVMLSIQQQFNDTYRRWYSIMIEDPSKETRIDENFTPIVEQDGFEQDIGFLSGGEKTGIALAYRLTLNALMRRETESMKSNLLILDEPTDGFSDSQLHKMKEVLDEMRSEQTILVSHDRELETFADSVFDVSKESGESRVVPHK